MAEVGDGPHNAGVAGSSPAPAIGTTRLSNGSTVAVEQQVERSRAFARIAARLGGWFARPAAERLAELEAQAGAREAAAFDRGVATGIEIERSRQTARRSEAATRGNATRRNRVTGQERPSPIMGADPIPYPAPSAELTVGDGPE